MIEAAPHDLLVVGAGIAGLTAALEAAEAGRTVVVVEREPSVGGRVLRLHHYFPKLCPPSCGMEINTRRIERNPRLRVLTQAEVVRAEKTAGGWSVTVRRAASFVNERCTACGACTSVCPAEVPSPHDYGMAKVKAIRLAHKTAWPKRYLLERTACPAGCKACADACQYQAVDLAAQPIEETFAARAVVVATGWTPYPLDKLPELGGGRFADVVANVQMERLASPDGPTGGKIRRPSDGQPPKRVAFVQCAGSRDVNNLPYCSAVCCLATLKQALYVKEQLPDTAVAIYYIDRRTPGRNEDMLTKVAALQGVRMVKGKVGKVERAESGELRLRVEDVAAGKVIEEGADLVVLATGMMPSLREHPLPLPLEQDEDGFVIERLAARLAAAGVAARPEDVAASVRDATGAAAKACMAARSA